jgi:hypothetical protein
MNTPTLVTSGTSIVISWTAPTDNGESIDEYTIQILNPSTLVYSEDTTDCDGSSGAIVSALTCTIPMSTLISNYGYSYGNVLRVRARAHNSNGYGGYSSLTTSGSTI